MSLNNSSLQNIWREVSACDVATARAYLLGAAHDGTFNHLHSTLRIAQSDRGWLGVLEVLFARLGSRSWIYREGKRNVWVIETSCRLNAATAPRNVAEQIAYVRGYFDAEGGIPTNSDARFYVQFTQKNKPDLRRVRDLLRTLGVVTGEIHNPSVRVDPEYWRFYVTSSSHLVFVDRISSWHPRKRPLLDHRLQPAINDR